MEAAQTGRKIEKTEREVTHKYRLFPEPSKVDRRFRTTARGSRSKIEQTRSGGIGKRLVQPSRNRHRHRNPNRGHSQRPPRPDQKKNAQNRKQLGFKRGERSSGRCQKKMSGPQERHPQSCTGKQEPRASDPGITVGETEVVEATEETIRKKQ